MKIANTRGKARRIRDAILKAIVEPVTIFMQHPRWRDFESSFHFSRAATMPMENRAAPRRRAIPSASTIRRP